MTEIQLQGLNQSEAKRKLASIQVVRSLRPIPDADNIEVARVLSWDVVVKKGSVEVGSKVVYFEIDSFLPDTKEYEFLGYAKVNPITLNTPSEEFGHRLRTAKLRNQVSQGLAMPFSTFEDSVASKLSELNEGADVTQLLGISKFERPEVAGSLGVSVSDFPTQYASKTDEERIQNEPHDYNALLGQPYFATAKYDGTSTTVIWIPEEGKFIYATRNIELIPGNQIEKTLKANGVYDKIKEFKDGLLVLQSELYGQGVQGNAVGIRGQRMATFNIFVDGVRQSLLNSIKIAGKLGLELPDVLRLGVSPEEDELIRKEIKLINKERKNHNPVSVDQKTGGPLPIFVEENSKEVFDKTIDELIDDANGTKYKRTPKALEGLVYRPTEETKSPNHYSFKVINNKFLLKSKD